MTYLVSVLFYLLFKKERERKEGTAKRKEEGFAGVEVKLDCDEWASNLWHQTSFPPASRYRDGSTVQWIQLIWFQWLRGHAKRSSLSVFLSLVLQKTVMLNRGGCVWTESAPPVTQSPGYEELDLITPQVQSVKPSC